MRIIDADALINEFDRTFLGNNPRGVIRATIENAPTIEPERKKGEWLHKSKQLAALNTAWWYECSICGYHAFNGMRTDFCPNCGADMRGES